MFQIRNLTDEGYDLFLIDFGAFSVFSIGFFKFISGQDPSLFAFFKFISGQDPSLFAFVAVCGLISAMVGHMIAAFKVWVVQRNIDIRNRAEFIRINDSLRESLVNVDNLNNIVNDSRERIEQQNKLLDENRERISDQHNIILSLMKRIEECKVVRVCEESGGKPCGESSG